MVTHGFRNQTNVPAQNHNCNANLSIEFADHLTVPEVEQRIAQMERLLREKHPEVIAVFVKPQSQQQFDAIRSRGYTHPADAGR